MSVQTRVCMPVCVVSAEGREDKDERGGGAWRTEPGPGEEVSDYDAYRQGLCAQCPSGVSTAWLTCNAHNHSPRLAPALSLSYR